MKHIVCELCGSKNVVRQNGQYLCKDCGTTYSLDEAKKLLVDAPNSLDASISESVTLDERAAKAKNKGVYLKWIGITLLIVGLILSAFCLYEFGIVRIPFGREKAYQEAISNYESENYEVAEQMFANLGSYKDSADWYLKAKTSKEKDAQNQENITVNQDFVLRNDIKFGDSIETVKSKETIPLTGFHRVDDKTGEETINSAEGIVSGFSETSIRYDFNAEHRLHQMMYDFPYTTSEESSDYRYKTLYDGLVRKYGNPLDIKKGNTHILNTAALDCANEIVSSVKSAGLIAELDECKEWLIPIENEFYDYVKIDLVSYHFGESYKKLNHYTNLAYETFTNEDIENTIYEITEQQQMIDDDL